MKETIQSIASDVGVDVEIRCIESWPSDDTDDVYQFRVTSPQGTGYVNSFTEDQSEEYLQNILEQYAEYVEVNE